MADLVSSRVGGGGDGGGRSLRGRLSGHSPSVGRGHRLGVVVGRRSSLPVKAMTCWSEDEELEMRKFETFLKAYPVFGVVAEFHERSSL